MTLLGTGGGRFATIFQERGTGGVYLRDGVNLHIDPGPGALVQMRRARLNPTKTDGILVSHCHPDHYTDAEILIEAMTNGTQVRRGLLAASRSVLEGDETFGPAISGFHSSMVENVQVMDPGDTLEFGPVHVTATPSDHSDPTAVGFRLRTSGGEVGYVSDTSLVDEVVEANRGVRVLIVPLTRPLRSRIDHHLCTEDAADLVAGTEPELAVLTHMGLKILREDPEVQADWISKKSGTRVVVGQDLMAIRLGNRVSVRTLPGGPGARRRDSRRRPRRPRGKRSEGPQDEGAAGEKE